MIWDDSGDGTRRGCSTVPSSRDIRDLLSPCSAREPWGGLARYVRVSGVGEQMFAPRPLLGESVLFLFLFPVDMLHHPTFDLATRWWAQDSLLTNL